MIFTRGRTVTIGSLIAALALIGTAAATLDMPVPKPAWKADVASVQAQVRDVDRLATQEALLAAQERLYQNLAAQEEWKAKGKPVPKVLIEQQALLESKVRQLQNRIDRLER